MVGLFSRFSIGKTGHRRARSALEGREVLPSNPVIAGAATATTAVSHGIEVAVEFKPVEHPIEPLDNDRPIQCPLPEPSILNDARIWKESVASARRRPDQPTMKEGGGSIEPESDITRQRVAPTNRRILPSASAPEHKFLNLLEECNASGI
ncbi:hypothetical protein SAY87_012745 [Trapa incisa]|uniref:Cystic fibrosis transmembrane conductance regulator n=1 Tax=Trapa incisa TaxID=236973 RepID=A0AAN7GTG0_9MYRT|nr:hypothetical protein SAY87_012745 [Trapa incisa]